MIENKQAWEEANLDYLRTANWAQTQMKAYRV